MTRHFLPHEHLLWFLIAAPLLFASATTAQPPDTLWTQRWGTVGVSYEKFECVNAVPSGGYIATGIVWTPDFQTQVITARVDDAGNDIWVHDEGLSGTDGAHYIEPTSDGGFIQCGETWSYAGGPRFDAFIRKLDTDGNTEWARVLGDDSQDLFTCVREVPAGGYITIGPVGEFDLYRFSSSGQILWRRTAPTTIRLPQWVEPIQDGGFIVPSWYYREDLQRWVHVLFKVNASGQLVWTNDESLPDQDPPTGWGTCVRENEEGFLYTCGMLSMPRRTRYVSKRNPDGSLIWGITIPNPSERDAEAYELVILPDGNIAVGGYFLDIDYNINMWLSKLSPDGDILWEYDQLGGDISSLTQGRDGGIVAAWYPRLSLLDNPEDPALIKFEPEVDITVQPWNSIIPESGGWLHYGAQVSNILVDPTSLDAWIVVTTPNGDRIQLNSFPVTLQPGATFTRPQINVWVPDYAPSGEYTLEAHLGVAPPAVPPGGALASRNMGLGSFTFTKLEP